jgi:hypothetical protein
LPGQHPRRGRASHEGRSLICRAGGGDLRGRPHAVSGARKAILGAPGAPGAPGLRGLERVTGNTANDSAAGTSLVVACPAGKLVVGTGFDIVGRVAGVSRQPDQGGGRRPHRDRRRPQFGVCAGRRHPACPHCVRIAAGRAPQSAERLRVSATLLLAR